MQKINHVNIFEHTKAPSGSNLPAFHRKTNFLLDCTDRYSNPTHKHEIHKLFNTHSYYKKKYTFFTNRTASEWHSSGFIASANLPSLPSADCKDPQTENLRLRCP